MRLSCFLLAGAGAGLFSLISVAADLPREHLSLDANWKFHLGDHWPDALQLTARAEGVAPASVTVGVVPARGRPRVP